MDRPEKRRVGFQSSLLVSPGVLAVCAAGALGAWWVGADGLGALLLAVAAAGLIGRLWGLYALRGLTAQAVPERGTLSVGERVTVRYTVKNAKALPLVWAELCQAAPPRGCLTPEGDFSPLDLPEDEAGDLGHTRVYARRLAFLPGYGELTWDTVWAGERRGVYRWRALVLRSGDGFGLTQSAGRTPCPEERTLVVWPKLVPVQTWPFLRHVWTGRTGRAGFSEDPTVLRGERAYQPGDPWKRIDWRVAARTDELMVRQFDTVTPLSVLFILDAAPLEDAEEAISLVASLICALERGGVDCGLALPATGASAPVLLRAEDPSTTRERCLYELAAFEAESAGAEFDERAIMGAAAVTGQVWLVSQGAASLSCPGLAGRLSERGVYLLAARRERGAAMTRVYTFDELRERSATA